MQFISVKSDDRFVTEVLVAVNKISAICVTNTSDCIIELDCGITIRTKNTKKEILSKMEESRKLDLKNVFSQ